MSKLSDDNYCLGVQDPPKDFYKFVFGIILEEYELQSDGSMNDFFIPNMLNQRSFFYLLASGGDTEKKLLIDILTEHGRKLIPTLNYENQ